MVTRKRLETIADERQMDKSLLGRQKELATAFREHMTEGQTYHSPNPYRSTFYTEVTNEAEEANFLSFPVFVRMTVFPVY